MKIKQKHNQALMKTKTARLWRQNKELDRSPHTAPLRTNLSTKPSQPDRDAVAGFGFSVSLSADGSRVAIGAPYNHDVDIPSGHVRVFDNSVVFADGFESGDTIAWSNSVP